MTPSKVYIPLTIETGDYKLMYCRKKSKTTQNTYGKQDHYDKTEIEVLGTSIAFSLNKIEEDNQSEVSLSYYYSNEKQPENIDPNESDRTKLQCEFSISIADSANGSVRHISYDSGEFSNAKSNRTVGKQKVYVKSN